MKDKLIMWSIKLETMLSDEQGQDLIEYALVVALIAFGAVAAMSTLSKDISSAFSDISKTLSANIT